MVPLYEVADVLRRKHHQMKELTLNSWQARALYAIEEHLTFQDSIRGQVYLCWQYL
jgi:hypothetical protein